MIDRVVPMCDHFLCASRVVTQSHDSPVTHMTFVKILSFCEENLRGRGRGGKWAWWSTLSIWGSSINLMFTRESSQALSVIWNLSFVSHNVIIFSFSWDLERRLLSTSGWGRGGGGFSFTSFTLFQCLGMLQRSWEMRDFPSIHPEVSRADSGWKIAGRKKTQEKENTKIPKQYTLEHSENSCSKYTLYILQCLWFTESDQTLMAHDMWWVNCASIPCHDTEEEFSMVEKVHFVSLHLNGQEPYT